MKELYSVAEGIGGVEAVVAREWLILPGFDTVLIQAAAERSQIGDLEGDVRLPGGMERLLNADVDLQLVSGEPCAASPAEVLGLLNFAEAERTGEEGSSLFLAPGRCSDLHVVDSLDPHCYGFLSQTSWTA